jgi:hypothetical protein
MALVKRHPLDDRVGFGLVRLEWAQGDTSRGRAYQERDNYIVKPTTEARGAFEVWRDGDPNRRYSVRYDSARDRGWCSCPGFVFQTRAGKGPCVHCWLVKLSLG